MRLPSSIIEVDKINDKYIKHLLLKKLGKLI